MEGAGLNSEVIAGGKKFHIQTNYLEPVEKIVSNIFDDGRVVFAREVQVQNLSSEVTIGDLIDNMHREIVSEIELLFYITEKVKTIRHAGSNYKLGIVFLHKNFFEEAKTEFRRALEIDPNFIDAYKNLGFTYFKNNEIEEAKAIIQDGIEKQPDFPDFHTLLGRIFLQDREYDRAFDEFQKALSLNPNYILVHFYIVVCLLKRILDKDYKDNTSDIQEVKNEVLEHLQNSEKILDSDTLIKVYEYFDEDDLENTLDVLENIKDIDPDESIASFENEFYLKFMFGGKGKDDKFISDHIIKLKEAIKKYPYYPDLRNLLGIAYLIQCRNLFLNALDEFRHALKINPKFKKAEKNLKLAENDGKGFLILLRAILK